MRKVLLGVIWLVVLLLLSAYSYRRSAEAAAASPAAATKDELLYLPSGQALQLVGLGYNNALANLLWFNAINYFGKHYRSDHNYAWLGHMCNLVTTLDPRATHVYEFCALMLAWEGGDPAVAMKILESGLVANPGYWRFHYLRGVNFAIFFKEEGLAQEAFVAGAKVEGSPPFMARLAAKKLANLDRPESAIEFLHSMVASASDPNQRAALNDQLNKTVHEVNLRKLQDGVDSFHAKKGRWPSSLLELRGIGIELRTLQDPFGGTYHVDGANGRVDSSSKVERIKLFQKK